MISGLKRRTLKLLLMRPLRKMKGKFGPFLGIRAHLRQRNKASILFLRVRSAV